MHTIRFLLIGLGNLGRRFCEILLKKDTLLRRRYGLELCLVGAADSRGAAYNPVIGLDPEKGPPSPLRCDDAAGYTGHLFVMRES